MSATIGRPGLVSGTPAGEEVFTTGQIAKRCRVAPRTVSLWIDNGDIKGYRLPGPGKDRRVTKSNLIAFLRKNNMPLGDLTEELRVLFVGCREVVVNEVTSRIEDAAFQFRSEATPFAAGGLVVEWRPCVVVIDFAIGTTEAIEMARHLKAGSQSRSIIGLIGEDATIRVAHSFDAIYQAPWNVDAVAEKVRALAGEGT